MINSYEENGLQISKMTSEDENKNIQGVITYGFKTVKAGKFAIAKFGEEKLCEDYDCTFNLLKNTMPDGIYCCRLDMPSLESENYNLIKEAAEKMGFKKFKNNSMILNF